MSSPQAAPGGGDARCLECGARNPAGNRFCRRCGATVDLVVLAGPSTLPTPTVTPTPGPQPPPPPRTGRPPAPAPPTAPTAPARPVAERGEGLQPAPVPARPGPVRPEPTDAPVAPGGPVCPACGTANEPGRRFCRRCGAALVPAPGPDPVVDAPRPPWWRRLLGRSGGAAPSARAAYRRTLALRFRVMRAMAVVATLGMGAGLVGVSGIDPVGGARDLWKRVFPRDEPVTEVAAAVEPVAAEQREYAASAAVDGAPDTAWAANWRLGPDADPVPACAPDPGTGGADAALVLTLPEPTKLSKLEVRAGLPKGDPDREHQWRPTLLELRYDGDECETVELSTDPGPQRHSIDAPPTRTIRITILDAAPPPSPDGTQVPLAELRLFTPT